MTKELLEDYVLKNYSIHAIAKYVGCSPTTVRHYLKKYELKTIRSRNNTSGKYCPACDSVKNRNDFYVRRKSKDRGEGLSGWCKICCNQASIERQRENKRTFVQEKGGKCINCGYCKNIAALEFHHLDPSSKDPSMKISKNTNIENLREEIDKCVLLCANCHREAHNPQLKGVDADGTRASSYLED